MLLGLSISDLLIRMGYTPALYDTRILFIDKILKRYMLDYVGRLCHIKTIPKECFQWSLEMRRALWESMMLGDGNKPKTKYVTTSKQLQEDFAILSLSLGHGVTLDNGNIRLNKNHHTLYAVSIIKTKGVLLYSKNISKNLNMETYCVEVEDNHNFFANNILVHNK